MFVQENGFLYHELALTAKEKSYNQHFVIWATFASLLITLLGKIDGVNLILMKRSQVGNPHEAYLAIWGNCGRIGDSNPKKQVK